MTTQTAAGKGLTIERAFNAPRELVWRAWTEPERVKQWWGPKGFTVPYVSIDLKVGGKYLFCMRSPDGKDFWSTGMYRELSPYDRLVVTDSFADEKGNVVPASYYGMAGDFPLELQVIVTLEERAGGTKMTLHHEGFPPGEPGRLAAEGWNESFDKLAEYLRREQGG